MATKKDLERSVVKKLSYLSEEDANFAVNCILDYIKDELAINNRVEIRGFGSLSVRKRKSAGTVIKNIILSIIVCLKTFKET